MADENQAPQNAIPPKAVPPQTAKQPTQVLPVAAPMPVPSTAPRTVRLKPVPASSAPVAADGAALPPVLPSAPPGSAAAAAAIKRMTSHLSDISADAATAKRSTAPLPAMSPPEPRKATSRLNVPSGMAPVAEVPKTIKIRPISGTPPATQPMPAADVGAAPLPSKSKTSRIPLETAMGLGSGDPSAPKTIRLKRPGDMSTVRVTVPGGGSGDASTITQKRTIKVKRPTAAAMPGAAAEGGEGSEGAPVLFTVAAAAPERGTGIFIAVAAICALAIIALMVVFSSQIFGPNASLTELSVWPGIDIPLPGTIAAEG